MDDTTPNRRSKWDSYDVEEELRTIDKKTVEVCAAVWYDSYSVKFIIASALRSQFWGVVIHVVMFTFRGVMLSSISFCNWLCCFYCAAAVFHSTSPTADFRFYIHCSIHI